MIEINPGSLSVKILPSEDKIYLSDGRHELLSDFDEIIITTNTWDEVVITLPLKSFHPGGAFSGPKTGEGA